MNPQDQDFPWVLRRDEIDILEDELEDLYETFHREGDVPSFESAILREQLDTEEQSDQVLSGRLGFDVLEPPNSVLSARESSAPPSDPISAWRQELSYVRAHPLFQKARQWATTMKPAARNGYEQGGAYAAECFRIYANANLVPLKIFTGMCEELHEDALGFEIAYEEYRLAVTYVERILESMSFMTFVLASTPWVETTRAGAEEIRLALLSMLQSLARRKQSFL